MKTLLAYTKNAYTSMKTLSAYTHTQYDYNKAFKMLNPNYYFSDAFSSEEFNTLLPWQQQHLN